MPLVKRTVTPTALCRQKLPRGVKNELECVTNNTLAGVIHQLASLSQHAEDIFGELFSEANSFYGRASSLKDRIDNLSVKVTQLDSNVEEVQLIDINSRKAFKSSISTDQQVVSRQSLPNSVNNTYRQADAPPPLQELNQFRDDGKDGLKIYTDPDYFFNLWREAIQKETREAKEKRREQRRRDKKANPDLRKQRTVRQAVNTRKQRAERMRHGAEFVDNSPAQQASTNVRRSSTARRKEQQHQQQQALAQKEYLPTPIEQNNIPQHPNQMPPPPPMDPGSPYPEPPPPIDLPPEPSYAPPPPVGQPPPTMSPPPPPMMNGEIPPPPPVNTGAPPAPPPPMAPPPPAAPPVPAPPPMMDGQGSSQSGLVAALQNVSLKKAEPQEAPVVDERSNLLQAIRIGINLKKVEQKERSQAPTSSGNDVASILARRIAVEFSDSDVSDSTLASDDDWED